MIIKKIILSAIGTLLLFISFQSPEISYSQGLANDMFILDSSFEKKADLPTGFDPKNKGKTTRGDTKFAENALLKIADFVQKVIGTLTFIWCVYAGFGMVKAQGEEDAINKSKRQLRWGILGLLMIFLIDPLVRNVFYGGGDIAPGVLFDGNNATGAATSGANELIGFVKYLQGFVALMALFMILSTGIRTVFSLDNEEAITNQKKTFTWSAIGIVIIFLSEIIVYSGVMGELGGGERNVVKVITEFSAMAKYFLGFLGVISVALLMYGGMLMITSRGEDDQVKQGKDILINTVIGISIIILSYTAVATFLA